MPHKPAEVAELKLKILDEMTKDPAIKPRRIAKKYGMDYRTAVKYMKENQMLLEKIKAQVETRINSQIQEKITLWQRITRLFTNPPQPPTQA